MKGVTTQVKVLMLIASMIVILVMVTSVFGRGIAFGILGIAAEVEPSFFQEELRSFLTMAATTRGDVEFAIPLTIDHTVLIGKESGNGYVHVKPPKIGMGALYSDPGKVYFFDNGCDVATSEITYSPKNNKALMIEKNITNGVCMISMKVLDK